MQEYWKQSLWDKPPLPHRRHHDVQAILHSQSVHLVVRARILHVQLLFMDKQGMHLQVLLLGISQMWL